jgi:hypothetical protein
MDLQFRKPDPSRALISAVTIAGSYIAGELYPRWVHYVVLSSASNAHSIGSDHSYRPGRFRLHQGPFHGCANDP